MFLALSGRIASGKDTSLTELIKKFPNQKFVRVGFGDYLKDICCDLFGLDRSVVHGPNKNVPTKYKWKDMPWYSWRHLFKRNKYVTHREFLQYFGTNICRKINNDCWVSYVLNKFTDKDTIYVMIDVRFPNEANVLVNSGNTVLLRLTRNPYNDKHVSESALDSYRWMSDEIVDNANMSIEQTTDEIVRQFNRQAERRGIPITLGDS